MSGRGGGIDGGGGGGGTSNKVGKQIYKGHAPPPQQLFPSQKFVAYVYV